MKKKKIIRSNLPEDIIVCECGAEILLVPDVKAMSKAIEAHVAYHTKGIKNSSEKTEEENRIREALIIQVFNLASKSENNKTPE